MNISRHPRRPYWGAQGNLDKIIILSTLSDIITTLTQLEKDLTRKGKNRNIIGKKDL